MEKINCNVIQDILPLYIDDVVSDDTKELVEEHLQNCEICQRVYHETKTDLENDMKVSVQTKESSNEANDLKSFRKFLKKRKIKTILLSIAATIVCFVAVFMFMNKHVTYISYKDAGITIIEDNKDEVTYDIILANLEETARQAGKQYKEWSGNIALKIGGRGESETTYNANVLTDQYKNQNMMELDG